MLYIFSKKKKKIMLYIEKQRQRLEIWRAKETVMNKNTN